MKKLGRSDGDARMNRRSGAGMLLCAGVCLAVLGTAGCAALAVGGAAVVGVRYARGELRSPVDAPPEKLIAATQKAFKDLKWTEDSAKSSVTDGKAEAHTGDNKKVVVEVKQKTPPTSEIGIRIGFMGDQDLSYTLLNKIKANL